MASIIAREIRPFAAAKGDTGRYHETLTRLSTEKMLTNESWQGLKKNGRTKNTPLR